MTKQEQMAIIKQIPIFYEGEVTNFESFKAGEQGFLYPLLTNYLERVGAELAQHILCGVK